MSERPNAKWVILVLIVIAALGILFSTCGDSSHDKKKPATRQQTQQVQERQGTAYSPPQYDIREHVRNDTIVVPDGDRWSDSYDIEPGETVFFNTVEEVKDDLLVQFTSQDSTWTWNFTTFEERWADYGDVRFSHVWFKSQRGGPHVVHAAVYRIQR